MRGADNAPAENFVALMGEVAGRREALQRFEFNQPGIAFSLMYETVLIFLPIPGFSTFSGAYGDCPPNACLQRWPTAAPGRMIMSLDDGQYIGVNIFNADASRYSGASDIQAMTLTKGVKPQALMFAGLPTSSALSPTSQADTSKENPKIDVLQ